MMQVFVRTLAGRSTTLDVESTDTVKSLKEKLYLKEGISAGDQRLVFGGKELDETRSLSDYNIRKESTLYMLLRLRGG